MSDCSAQLRVTAVRSRGGFGGVIFSGVNDDGQAYVAKCPFTLLPDASLVQKGQIWAVAGTLSVRAFQAANGFDVKEKQIAATSAQLVRPAGRNIITWIAESPECAGIGQVKARKLYDRFGPELGALIEQRDFGALTEVISDEAAQLLCHAFDKHKVASALVWLDQMGIQRRIGTSVVTHYKADAQAKVEANPYLLISFEEKWTTVDELARKRFGVQGDDRRRLESAVEESLHRGLAAGHTCLPEKDVQASLVKLLGTTALASLALSQSENATAYRRVNGFLQAQGPYLIESHVAQRLRDMIAGEQAQGQQGLFAPPPADLTRLDAILNAYERAQAIELTQAQRNAVCTSAAAPLSLILGGAGTGKTTVLKALYEALEALQPGVVIHQLALSGRAAQRMTEATGRPSATIAGFLVNTVSGQLGPGTVIVVDESSMVDVILMYRLLRFIPAGVRLILVGDPAQLPPIGPGLVLHALDGLAEIPQTALKQVKRQSASSGIPQVAATIRSHQDPDWCPYQGRPHAGVSFVPCPPEQLEQTVQQVHAELGADGTDFSVQILAITNGNVGGVKPLNAALHDRFLQGAEPVLGHDPQHGVVWASTIERLPLKVGSLVIQTVNNYELGLRNGALGKIVKALPVEGPDDLCCVCSFDGIEHKLTCRQANALNHAFAITVHKAQGSQFARVIVPVQRSRLLDQALIYTAVTRGVDQVVLVGDEQAALDAIRAPASAARRHIGLPSLLKPL